MSDEDCEKNEDDEDTDDDDEMGRECCSGKSWYIFSMTNFEEWWSGGRNSKMMH